jgi:hypothetical protein
MPTLRSTYGIVQLTLWLVVFAILVAVVVTGLIGR